MSELVSISFISTLVSPSMDTLHYSLLSSKITEYFPKKEELARWNISPTNI